MLQLNRLKVLAMSKDLENSFKSYLKFLSSIVASQADLSIPDEKVVDKWIEQSMPFVENSVKQKRFNLLRKYMYDHNSRWEQYINNLGNEIKDSILPSLAYDSSIPTSYLDLLKYFGGYFRNLSESPLKNIMQKSNVLNDPNVSKIFTYDINTTQDQAIKKATRLAEKILGKGADPNIPAATKKELRKKYADNDKMLDLIKEQTKAYSEIKNIYKQHLSNIVRRSGKPYLPVEQVKKQLAKEGIVRHTIPKGFVGNVGDDGSLYTTEGLKIQGVPNGSVRMNPDYDPKKDNTSVFLSDGDGTFKEEHGYYTVHYKDRGRKHKFETVEKVNEVIDKVREKWLKNLHRWTGDRANVASLMMEIMYNVSSRIGSEGAATDGKPTFGTSTWRVKHIKFDGDRAIIKYTGKKGQPLRHVLDPNKFPEHRLIIDRLKKLVKNKKPNDRVFTDNNGKPVTAPMVNAQLKAYGCPATAHKLRHVKGTRMAKKLFAKSPFDKRKNPPKQAEVDKWVKTTVEKIGKQLGHQVTKADGTKKVQWSTSMNNYISPSVVKDFYNRIGVHIPKFLEKLKEED